MEDKKYGHGLWDILSRTAERQPQARMNIRWRHLQILMCALGLSACTVIPVKYAPCDEDNSCALGYTCASGECVPNEPVFDASGSTTPNPVDSGWSEDMVLSDSNGGDEPFCGDGICSSGEDANTCASDCATCGDGICSPGEDANTCASDCATCGDGICSFGEDANTCASDCATCGDSICSPGEDANTCASDCATCGDSICSSGEDANTCASDCATCGDNICSSTEDFSSCASDCATCGDGACSNGETLTSCAADCGVCGDTICSSVEDLSTCPEDCKVCGDETCSLLENAMDCPSDCGSCGDGICDPTEGLGSCLEDCAGDPNPANGVVGVVEGYELIPTQWGNGIKIKGWACHQGWAGSILVQIYLGPGSPIMTTTNIENEQTVHEQCGTTAGTHRFEVVLDISDVSQKQGEAIVVFGLTPVIGSSTPLEQSGQFIVPAPSP